MMLSYMVWGGIATIVAMGGTWAALAWWNRWVEAEAAQLRQLVDARDTEARARAEAERSAAAALAASERRYRALTEAGAIVVWQAAPTGHITAIEGWTAFTGGDAAAVIGSPSAWLDAAVPEDRARVTARWNAAVAEGQPMDIEFRATGADGEPRWCRARAVLVQTGGTGARGEWIGVLEDIDGRRRAEEARLLLAREVNHRAKNMLAVVQAVVRLTRATEPDSFAAAVSARIAALGRAHDLLAQRDWQDVGIEDLVRGELAAHLGPRERIRMAGPRLRLSAAAVQPLAIVIHELAVNAAKYGALSTPVGTVEVSWRSDEAGGLLLRWTERGGPVVAGPPSRLGFGTRVIDASVREQLGGKVERHWSPGGLDCEIRLPPSRIEAPLEAAR